MPQPDTQSPLYYSMKEYLETIRLKLAYRISVSFLIIFMVLTYAYYFDSFESFITMAFGFFLSAFCLITLRISNNYQLVIYIYSICGVLVTSYALIMFHETIHFADMLWMLAAVSLAFFGIGKKAGFILLAISLISITYFILYSLNINIRVVQERTLYQEVTLIMEVASGFGITIYLFLIFHNFYQFSQKEMMKVNEELLAQNALIKEQDEEKTILVREVHHRVKNNLQIIISLLRTQAIEVNDPRVDTHFQESISRIMAMSHIHKKLYSQESLKNVRFSAYLEDLANDLIGIYGAHKKIDLTITSSVEQIGLRSIVPLGLLFNELLSNSLKYAFKEMETGNITINLSKEGADFLITYKDNGNWITREEYKGFGLSLIDTLTEQLDGTKELFTSENETKYVFRLANLEI